MSDEKPQQPIVERIQPCARRTWCIRPEHGDDEPCHEVPREKLPATDFGPNAATRRRH